MPVCPTCSLWGRHPASTTALEAPTAAPSVAAKFSIKVKCSGPFKPLPPETIISASETSRCPSFLIIDITLTLA